MLRKILNAKVIIAFFISLIAIFFHLFKLTQVPNGIYLDELSVGVAAKHISYNLHDEHGNYLPLYFQAFGDYKNPIYIYAAAILFKLFGISIFTLKFTGFLFWISSLFGFYKLLNLLIKNNKAFIFTFTAFAFLPQYFAISRVSFELISTLPFLVWFFYFLFKSFEVDKAIKDFSEAGKKKIDLYFSIIFYSLASAFCLGLTFYSYSTMRLFVPLIILTTAIFYLKKHTKILFFQLGILIFLLLPFIINNLHDPVATYRFKTISYLYQDISLLEKAGIFIVEYFKHWRPDYIFLVGDGNLRHGTGFFGLITPIIALLSFLSIIYILLNLSKLNNYYKYFLLLILLSPIPSALTNDSTPHTLRNFTFGLFAVILSGLFLQKVFENKNTLYNFDLFKNIFKRIRSAIIFYLLMSMLIFEISAYLYHYFNIYPEKSTAYFGAANWNKKIETLKNKGCSEIYVTNVQYPEYHIDWFETTNNINMSEYTPQQNNPNSSIYKCLIN